MFTEKKIDEIMLNTCGAYSFDRYGPIAWRKSIENLGILGYTKKQTESILRSVGMRFAADSFGVYIGDDDAGYELLDGTEIVKYHNQYARNGKLKESK